MKTLIAIALLLLVAGCRPHSTGPNVAPTTSWSTHVTPRPHATVTNPTRPA